MRSTRLLRSAALTEDSCMDMLTEGRSARMSDARLAFRAGGSG